MDEKPSNPKAAASISRAWSRARKSGGHVWLALAGYLAYGLLFNGVSAGNLPAAVVTWVAVAGLTLAGVVSFFPEK